MLASEELLRTGRGWAGTAAASSIFTAFVDVAAGRDGSDAPDSFSLMTGALGFDGDAGGGCGGCCCCWMAVDGGCDGRSSSEADDVLESDADGAGVAASGGTPAFVSPLPSTAVTEPGCGCTLGPGAAPGSWARAGSAAASACRFCSCRACAMDMCCGHQAQNAVTCCSDVMTSTCTCSQQTTTTDAKKQAYDPRARQPLAV